MNNYIYKNTNIITTTTTTINKINIIYLLTRCGESSQTV